MKTIMFVCNHLYGGGAERVLVSLANYFVSIGYKISIVAYDAQKRYPIDKNVQIYEIENIENTEKVSKVIRQIRKYVKMIKPDVVIAFEYYVNICAIFACMGMNTNVIVSERNDPAIVGAKFPNNLIRNIAYHFCDSLVCQTNDAKAYFSQTIQKHSVVILNPLKQGLPHKWDGNRELEVVNFCRLNEQKNIPLLIDAFVIFNEKFPEYKLSIFGNGSEKEKLKKYIRKIGMEGKIFIFDAQTNIHERILKSAMFVSSSDYEGLSNSMLEAMAIGLPVVCTDCPCGGARMVIDEGKNGFLVPTKDAKKMAEKMVEIASDDDLARAVSTNASRINEKLNIEYIAKQWEKLF